MKKIYFALLAVLSSFAFVACLEEDPNPASGQLSPYITFEDVKSLYRGQDVPLVQKNLIGATSITGVVISDAAAQNIPKGNLVLQQRKRGRIRGIMVDLGEASTIPYVIGDSVVVNVTKGTLTSVQGQSTITGVTLADITKVGSGKVVKPQVVSLGELNKNFAAYESTLIQVVGGDIDPTPARTDTYKGNKRLRDGSADSVLVTLHTENNAAFANAVLPANATFTGIAVNHITESNPTQPERQIWMRNIADAQDPSGPRYPGFPESFERLEKTTYAAANLVFPTGVWRLENALLGTTAGRDRFNPTGLQAVRFNQNLSTSAYLQMNFDVPNGATKVSLIYGAYYTDPKSSWRLEYSTDAGKTWKQIGATITDAPAANTPKTFLMDIKGPVRFRINKLGLGTSNNTTIQNGRLSIDDFAVYSQQ